MLPSETTLAFNMLLADSLIKASNMKLITRLKHCKSWIVHQVREQKHFGKRSPKHSSTWSKEDQLKQFDTIQLVRADILNINL